MDEKTAMALAKYINKACSEEKSLTRELLIEEMKEEGIKRPETFFKEMRKRQYVFFSRANRGIGAFHFKKRKEPIYYKSFLSIEKKETKKETKKEEIKKDINPFEFYSTSTYPIFNW